MEANVSNIKDAIKQGMMQALKNGGDKQQIMVKVWDFLGVEHGTPVSDEAVEAKIKSYGYELTDDTHGNRDEAKLFDLIQKEIAG